jgi:hypothetical protein
MKKIWLLIALGATAHLYASSSRVSDRCDRLIMKAGGKVVDILPWNADRKELLEQFNVVLGEGETEEVESFYSIPQSFRDGTKSQQARVRARSRVRFLLSEQGNLQSERGLSEMTGAASDGFDLDPAVHNQARWIVSVLLTLASYPSFIFDHPIVACAAGATGALGMAALACDEIRIRLDAQLRYLHKSSEFFSSIQRELSHFEKTKRPSRDFQNGEIIWNYIDQPGLARLDYGFGYTADGKPGLLSAYRDYRQPVENPQWAVETP